MRWPTNELRIDEKGAAFIPSVYCSYIMSKTWPAPSAPLGTTGQRAEADVFAADGSGKIRLLLRHSMPRAANRASKARSDSPISRGSPRLQRRWASLNQARIPGASTR